MAADAGNPAQIGEKLHEDSGEGPSRGMSSLSKQDTEAIKRLSESGAVVGAQGDKTAATAATTPGQ